MPNNAAREDAQTGTLAYLYVCETWMSLKREWIVSLKCRIEKLTDTGFLFRREAYGGDRNRLS